MEEVAARAVSMAATISSENSNSSDCDCFTPLERATSEREGLIGYDHVGLYTVMELDYAEQQTGCLNCNGVETCKWRGRQVMYYIDHEIKKVCWTIRDCGRAAAVNRQLAFERRLATADVPSRYRGKTIADFDGTGNTAALLAIKSVASGKSAILYGGRGTGKTMLAAIVAQKLIRDRRDVVFETAPSMFERLRRGMNDDSIATRRARLAKADLLVIDDLGAEQTTAWTLEQLYMVVNDRYNEARAMLITTNDSPARLRQKWAAVSDVGERIYSRLREMTTAAEVTGSDRRLGQ